MIWLRIYVEIFTNHFHSLQIVLHHSHSIVFVLRSFPCNIQLISFTLFIILSITRLKGIEPFPCRILVIIGTVKVFAPFILMVLFSNNFHVFLIDVVLLHGLTYVPQTHSVKSLFKIDTQEQ
jgi:hypothetical protein